MAKATKTRKVNIDAKSGQFVSNEKAKKNPGTTVAVTTHPKTKTKKK